MRQRIRRMHLEDGKYDVTYSAVSPEDGTTYIKFTDGQLSSFNICF